jgi:hypothetical protein
MLSIRFTCMACIFRSSALEGMEVTGPELVGKTHWH